METPSSQRNHEQAHAAPQVDTIDHQLPEKTGNQHSATPLVDDIAVNEVNGQQLQRHLAPPEGTNKPKKPQNLQQIVSAYAYSSSDEEESDSLADSLSPNLINEAILGRFQPAAQAAPTAQAYRIANRTAVARRNYMTQQQTVGGGESLFIAHLDEEA